MSRFRYFVANLIHKLSQITPRTYTKLIVFGGCIYISKYYLWPRIKPIQHQPIESKSQQKPSSRFLIHDHYNFLVRVTEKCAPAVVAIEIKNSVQNSPETGEPKISSSGSGFMISNNGWILTNAHVVMNKPNSIVTVLAQNGKNYLAKVHDIDLKLDLALLKIECDTMPALKLGNSECVVPGEWVVALGNPLALKHSITAGVISSVGRTAHELGIPNYNINFLQTDAAITFGHSGGPLVNVDGEVIGINNLRVTAGIAFAIPIDYVKDFLLRSSMYSTPKNQVNDKPPFGITTLALNKDVVQKLMQESNFDVPKNLNGIFVWNVVKDSPAHKAGFVVGDIITHVNKRAVIDASAVYETISRENSRLITFTIYRLGKRMELYSKPTQRK